MIWNVQSDAGRCRLSAWHCKQPLPKENITIDDIESSWAGLRPLIAGNSASDYNGGNNGTISDESFNSGATVEAYLSERKKRVKMLNLLLASLKVAHLRTFGPICGSRGSSLDRDDMVF